MELNIIEIRVSPFLAHFAIKSISMNHYKALSEAVAEHIDHRISTSITLTAGSCDGTKYLLEGKASTCIVHVTGEACPSIRG